MEWENGKLNKGNKKMENLTIQTWFPFFKLKPRK